MKTKLLMGTVASAALFAGAAFAQTATTEDTNAATQTTTSEATATNLEVDVQTDPATITVERQAPIITIEQGTPEIIVRIPDPIVTVQMPEPNIDVETSEPDVQVSQNAQPEVRINRAEANVTVEQGDPQIRMVDADGNELMTDDQDNMDMASTEEDMGAATDTAMTDTAAVLDDADEPTMLSNMTVAEFVGLPVVNDEGERIGEIDYVVDGNPLNAVIGIGGFLGLGEYTVALPVDDFAFNAERNELRVSQTADQLRDMPEFDETGVDGLPEDTVLRDVM